MVGNVNMNPPKKKQIYLQQTTFQNFKKLEPKFPFQITVAPSCSLMIPAISLYQVTYKLFRTPEAIYEKIAPWRVTMPSFTMKDLSLYQETPMSVSNIFMNISKAI